jgi:hypothetical protein
MIRCGYRLDMEHNNEDTNDKEADYRGHPGFSDLGLFYEPARACRNSDPGD